MPCSRVRGPSDSFTWPVTTGGVVQWMGCDGWRTCIAAWAGVRVDQPGAARFARRSAIGDLGGATSACDLYEVWGALVRIGEDPSVRWAPLPPLPP